MIAINNNIYIPNATTITISTPLYHIHITVNKSLSSYHNNSSDMNHLTNSNTTTIITTSSTIYSYYKNKRSHTICLSPIQSLPNSPSLLLVTTTIITIFLNSRLTIKTNFYNNNNMNINNNEGVTYPISPSFLSSTYINKDISNINDIIDVNINNNNSNNNKNIKNDEND
ncbi:hypothetical protein WA158_007353 [Blastocystis sp. Blastoise]